MDGRRLHTARKEEKTQRHLNGNGGIYWWEFNSSSSRSFLLVVIQLNFTINANILRQLKIMILFKLNYIFAQKS